MDELKERLISIANEEAFGDQEDVNPSNNGNYDDAYEWGLEDGKIYLARSLCNLLGLDYDTK